MANTIRVKRRASGSPGAPTSLENAELAFNEVDMTLYYGKGSGGVGGTATTVEAIGGNGAFVDKSTNQTIGGVKNFTSSPEVPTPAPGDNTTKVATTAFAKDVAQTEAAAAAQVVQDYVDDMMGQPDGLATLDNTGKIPTSQLPAYVDDVLEAGDYNDLPATGETGKIYVTLDDGAVYRWTGSTYVEIVGSPGSTDSVAEGSTNLYFTETRVRGTFLTGLSLLAGTTVAATHTVLEAIGFLQNQITALASTVSGLSSTISGKLTASNNLSDLANAGTARTNLGLGSMATQDASSVAITGGTINGVTLDGGTF